MSSGPIRLPDETETDGADRGVYLSTREMASKIFARSKAELIMRVLVIVTGVVVAILFGCASVQYYCYSNASIFSYLSPWPAIFLSFAHLICQSSLADLLTEIEHNGESSQAVKKFRRRLGAISFWADMIAALILFIGSAVALLGRASWLSKAGGMLEFVLVCQVLLINTDLAHYASRRDNDDYRSGSGVKPPGSQQQSETDDVEAPS